MKDRPKITDAEFEVVSAPNNPIATRGKEPILTRGWWWKLALFVGFFGALSLWRLHTQGAWPFDR